MRSIGVVVCIVVGARQNPQLDSFGSSARSVRCDASSSYVAVRPGEKARTADSSCTNDRYEENKDNELTSP